MLFWSYLLDIILTPEQNQRIMITIEIHFGEAGSWLEAGPIAQSVKHLHESPKHTLNNP